MNRAWLGLDPGASGAACVLDSDARILELWGFKDAGIDSATDIRDRLADLKSRYDLTCTFERVQDRAGMASMFAFGRSFGLLQGILLGLNIPFELVPPRGQGGWQNGLGIPTKLQGTERKKELKSITQSRWPDPPRKITLANADAPLIAEYGLRRGLWARKVDVEGTS